MARTIEAIPENFVSVCLFVAFRLFPSIVMINKDIYHVPWQNMRIYTKYELYSPSRSQTKRHRTGPSPHGDDAGWSDKKAARGAATTASAFSPVCWV